MALVLKDRVQETGTANTTVSFTLSGAVQGFQSFAAIGNGNTTFYEGTDASGNWETGLGTYSTTGPTLTRTTILASSNAGAAVTFSGPVNVFVTYPSSKSVNLDASGNVSALGTVASGTWQGTTVGVAYGGTGVTASSGANSVVLRDANQNTSANHVSQSLSVTTSAAGTTVLTLSSAYHQILTGTTTQTYQLPDATTLPTGYSYLFDNDSTGNLFIVNNASGAVDTVAAGGYAIVFLENNSTVAGTWGRAGLLPNEVNWGTLSADLGNSTITNAVWNGTTIASGYGGTGLTTFTAANNAIYSTSASALAAGTLPVAAGGTGNTSGQAASVANSLTAGTGLSGTAYNGSAAQTWNLANTAVTAGSYTYASLTVDAQGRLTAASSGTAPVTSVTGTAPVVSSGGTTPAISMAAATSLANGYLTSTDWSTFNGKQAALVSGTNIKTVNSTSLLGSGDVSVGVTSVTGTAPVVSSGGATPAISMAAANTTTNGYLTSTDWNTFNGKGSGTVTTVSVVSANGFAGTVATATSTPAITLTTSITGVLKGNGTAISAATAGTDYSAGTSALATGIVKSTTTTGTLSIAVAGTDYVAPGGALGTPSSGTLTNCTFPTLNQNTTGSAATFTSTTQNSQFNSIGVGTAGSAVAGEIRATNNVTAYYVSDIKFKTNVSTITSALDKVVAIGGKEFDWTDEYITDHGGEDGYFIRKHDFGVIAQDVQAVYPLATRTKPDGTLAVDYEKLCALAFQAIAELKAEVDALKAK